MNRYERQPETKGETMGIKLKRQTLEGAKGVIAEEMAREYDDERFKSNRNRPRIMLFDVFVQRKIRLLQLKAFEWQVSHAKTWKALAAATDSPAARQFGWQVDAKGRSFLRSEQEHVAGCSCGAPWCSEFIAALRGE